MIKNWIIFINNATKLEEFVRSEGRKPILYNVIL